MKKLLSITARTVESPWLDETKNNLFREEFRLISDSKIEPEILSWGPNFTPIPIYQWVFDNGGVDLFYKTLARFSPMFRVAAYKGQTAVWVSPPPSGSGNVICVVMGHDANGVLRSVGGNLFQEPRLEKISALDSKSFFNKYDSTDDRERQQLVRDTVRGSIKSKDKTLISKNRYECDLFHTMPIFFTALTGPGSLFHASKALIEGERPADFSYEFFGEIK